MSSKVTSELVWVVIFYKDSLILYIYAGVIIACYIATLDYFKTVFKICKIPMIPETILFNCEKYI